MSDSSSYSSRQRARDDDYRRQYEQWVATLPEHERQKLEALGVDAPSLPGPAGGTLRDAATSSRARCEDEFNDDEEADHDAEHQLDEAAEPVTQPASDSCSDAPQAADGEHLHDLLRRLVGELVGQNNARLSLECLALVTGLAYDGDSMTEIAKRHGVTRAAVSKRCVELTQALNLKPSRAMRSLKARHSYRSARNRHLRRHS